MDTGLKAKNVLITDAANPISKTLALAFAREGANLLLGSATDEAALAKATAESSALGTKVVASLYDSSAEASAKQFVQKGCDELGHIDVLVHNPYAAETEQRLPDISFEAWEETIHRALTGAVFICRAVLPGMIQQRWGRVIHYIGLNGFVGANLLTSTAEMGVVGLTRGIATQYGRYHITANCIGYGAVDSLDSLAPAYPLAKLNDPLGRLGTAEEVSSAAIYLASESAGYITGQCHLVNGGKYFL